MIAQGVAVFCSSLLVLSAVRKPRGGRYAAATAAAPYVTAAVNYLSPSRGEIRRFLIFARQNNFSTVAPIPPPPSLPVVSSFLLDTFVVSIAVL